MTKRTIRGQIQYMILIIFSVAICALYNNCVGQARGSVRVISSLNPNDIIIYEQPSIDKIEGSLFDEAEQTPHITKITIEQMDKGSAKEVPRKWKVGDYTGLVVPSLEKSRFERAANEDSPSTAVQFYGNEAGMLVYPSNSETLLSEKQPVVLSQDWTDIDDIRPWAEAQSAFVYTSDIQIPKMVIKNPRATGTLTAMMKFKDTKSGAEFWFKNMIFDNKTIYPKESVNNIEVGENSVGVVSSLFKDHAKYNTTVSGQFTNETWTGYRKFAFAITKANFNNMIGDLKKYLQTNELQDDFSVDPADYVLIHYQVKPEIIYPDYKKGLSERKSQPTYLGTSIRNIKLLKTTAHKPVTTCGLGWETMGVFSCMGKKEHQQICGCRPQGLESNAWTDIGSDCYERATVNSCKVSKLKLK